MADIALVFHWPPAVMDALEVDELMQWHERALARFKLVHGGE
ncbi:GpE family phage tail protein [Novosphingopyxis sp. YJ-S2-01]|nr:GpE family phage tail protein [Novosphingopyxis sp. YJ-S2-01]MBH9536919.1 GpE family phage tail protein [Novosphingopyxis sp. YJ-S2-01]